MYFPYFVTYIIIGFGISLVVFLWALNHGQFRDQQRARFLPLEEEPSEEAVKVSGFNRIEAYALLILALAGLAASGAVLVCALWSFRGL